jgi:alpha-beta hydrolase superfamily lysophospholipase
LKNTEFALEAVDGLHLYGQVWEPEVNPKALVALVHGLGEHSGRYAHVAEVFCQAGFVLLAVDLRGHGKSQGKRGHASSYEILMDDIGRQLEESARRYPGLPRFLCGHSLGGNLVLSYGLQRKPELAGVISTGPALRLAFTTPGWKLGLGKVLYNLWPSALIPSGLDCQGLCHDPLVVQAYEADPLVHDRVSARLGLDFLLFGEWELVHAGEWSLPLLLMHGEQDGLTSASASRRFAECAGPRCTLKIWPGLYHEIHNEPEKAEVLAFMVSWLDKIMALSSIPHLV